MYRLTLFNYLIEVILNELKKWYLKTNEHFWIIIFYNSLNFMVFLDLGSQLCNITYHNVTILFYKYLRPRFTNQSYKNLILRMRSLWTLNLTSVFNNKFKGKLFHTIFLNNKMLLITDCNKWSIVIICITFKMFM